MSVKALVQDTVKSNKVVVYSKSWCPHSAKAKKLLQENYPDVQVKITELDQTEDGDAIQAYLFEWTGQKTVPNIFINNEHIGGNDKVTSLQQSGDLAKLLKD